MAASELSGNSAMAWESPSKVALGCVAFTVFWITAIFPSVPFLPVGRVAGTVLSACLMVVFRVISPDQAFAAIDLPIMCLLFGTMLISAYLERADLFKYLGIILGWNCRGGRDLLCRVCILSGISSALLTNDTTCFILTPFLLDLCKKRKFPPRPFLLALATSSNIGSAATAIGNPQNVIIAIEGHVVFLRFLRGILPAVLVGLVINILALSFLFWSQLSTGENGLGMAEEYWAWSSNQDRGTKEEGNRRNPTNSIGIRRLRKKFRHHFWKDMTEQQQPQSLSTSPTDDIALALPPEGTGTVSYNESHTIRVEKENENASAEHSSCVISVEIPGVNSYSSAPQTSDYEEKSSRENVNNKNPAEAGTSMEASLSDSKAQGFVGGADPEYSAALAHLSVKDKAIATKQNASEADIPSIESNVKDNGNEPDGKAEKSLFRAFSFFSEPTSPSATSHATSQSENGGSKDCKMTENSFHSCNAPPTPHSHSQSKEIRPERSFREISHESGRSLRDTKGSGHDLSFRSLPAPLPLTGVAMEVEESVMAEEEASRGVRRPQGVLWKSTIYLATLGMLACLLAGLNLSWVAVSVSVFMMIVDFVDATPMLDKVSYSLLIFFAGMFITVKGFNQTGVPGELWKSVEPYIRLDSFSGLSLLAAVVTLLSNVASNVPTVLLLGPRLAASASYYPNVSVTRAWLMLAWISTVAGNLTLMGSAANLIVSEQARSVSKNRCNLSFFSHLRFGLLSTVIIIAAGIPLIR